jgi:hypothetical protein
MFEPQHSLAIPLDADVTHRVSAGHDVLWLPAKTREAGDIALQMGLVVLVLLESLPVRVEHGFEMHFEHVA